jgi:hypothetical protein
MKTTLKMDVLKKQKEEEKRFEQFVQIKNIQEKIIKKYKFSSTTEVYDVSVMSGDTVMIAEIKVRADKDIAYFEKYGPFLELKKIEGMQRKQNEINALFGDIYPNVEKFYFNFCLDGIMIYKLLDPWDYNFEWRYLPKDNTNVEQKIWKMVHSLHFPIEIIKYNK